MNELVSVIIHTFNSKNIKKKNSIRKNSKYFSNYSEKHIHFFDEENFILLEDVIKKLSDFSFVDIGCGDGRTLYYLYNRGFFKKAKRVYGIDISEERIKRFKILCHFAYGIVSDASNIKDIKDSKFDIAISSQVIEHVSNDSKMLEEIHRILKPNGYLYISTVIKKWYGFYIYWDNGFKLDPTHIREYKSSTDFINLLQRKKFKILKVVVKGINYPILDLFLRLLININLIKPDPKFYFKHKIFKKMRFLKIPILGYQTIEVLCKVKK